MQRKTIGQLVRAIGILRLCRYKAVVNSSEKVRNERAGNVCVEAQLCATLHREMSGLVFCASRVGRGPHVGMWRGE